MSEVRRILVATDFSAGAHAAVERAVQLARSHRAALDVLHAFDASALHRLRAVFDARRLAGEVPPDVVLRERLEGLAADLQRSTGLEVTPRFGVGDPAHAIETQVRATHPAVVVLARRAEPQTPGMGSTLLRVLRTVAAPILVVRGDAAETCRRVLSAVDLRDVSRTAAQAAVRLFPGAEHRLLCVIDPVWEREVWRASGTQARLLQGVESVREEVQGDLSALASQLSERYGAQVGAEVVDGVPARVLIERARAQQVDCVAAGRHGQGLLAERWLGSTVLDMIHHAPCDILVVS
jgi:nucleotide-binding universal stress UspA family protein